MVEARPGTRPRLDPESFRFTVMLGLLAGLPALSIDISQPTMLIAQQQLAARPETIGLTLTLFMVGFAGGQFAAGPISDRRGRRPVLMVGLMAYALAAIGCALATTAEMLVALRLVQGIASGACAVLAFTIIRDLFEGDAARAKRSYVTVVFALAPMVAPTLGAWLLEIGGWRPVYAVSAAGGGLLLLCVLVGLPESRSGPAAAPLRLAAAYAAVFSNRRFVAVAAVNALSYGGIFAYIAGSPSVLMGRYSLSAYSYGLVFASTAAALTTGAWVSGRSVRMGLGPRSLIWVSLVLAAASAIALVVALAFDAVSLVVLVPLLLMNLFCRGLTGPNTQHLALEPMQVQAGTAAAAVGVMQILTGALSSGLVAMLLPVIGPSGMAVVMAALALGALAMWLVATGSDVTEGRSHAGNPALGQDA